MKGRARKASSLRNTKGAIFITEIGPALYLLLICFFFPLLNVMSLGFVYGCGYYLNYFQSLQCASVPKSEAAQPSGMVKFGIPQQWKSVGLGRFAQLIGDPTT